MDIVGFIVCFVLFGSFIYAYYRIFKECFPKNKDKGEPQDSTKESIRVTFTITPKEEEEKEKKQD